MVPGGLSLSQTSSALDASSSSEIGGVEVSPESRRYCLQLAMVQGESCDYPLRVTCTTFTNQQGCDGQVVDNDEFLHAFLKPEEPLIAQV